ncbi:MAG TPA: TonB-dependent receptor plug domain-containing protein, partial [Opitutaceae bacterium]
MVTPPSLPSPAVGTSLRLLGCALLATHSALAADATRKSYNIAAGDAAVTLKRLVDQSSDQVFYMVDAVRGIETNAVKGDFTVREVLDRMVANTSLTIVQDEKTGALYVTRNGSRQPGEPPSSDAPDGKPRSTGKRPLARLGAFLALLTTANAQSPQSSPAPEEAIELSPFEVNTSRSQGYRTEEANTGTIIAVERDRIPFQTSVVTSELIKDLQIDNPADLAQTIAGVSKNVNPGIADEAGQGSLSFMVRGFSSTPLYNGFQTGGRVLGVDNIGRVEVSKGPNSVLYGQSPGGGIINIIPKMPRFDQSFLNTSAGVGSNGWYRGSFELGGPLKSAEDETNRGEMAFR